jgi:signal transduction histidine kinase
MEDELRQSHESLERRVAERTAELLQANERLQREIIERKRAEEARDEFLSVAAHELKTPMTSLRGFAQVLLGQLDRGQTPDPARLTQALNAVDRQTEKLARLVSQLLDVSRLEAGHLLLDPQPTDLVGIVESVAEGARARTSRHSIEVRAPAACPAVADALRLEQVLTNLVDNAIKYSPGGGRVDAELWRQDGAVCLAVTDRGIGVPPEHRGRIFERFHQAHGEKRFGGLGLGLYISRQIVELHGGTIEAQFPEVGGTRIVVTLPAGDA